MTEQPFQRARSPAAKAQRYNAILAASAEILDAKGIDGVTLQAIADDVGIVKSSIYRYFESREEILLRLLLSDLYELVVDMEARFAADVPLDLVAQAYAEAFVTRPRLCLLISQLAPTLERNVTGDTLRDVKTSLLGLAQRAVTALNTALPAFSEHQCLAAVNTLFSVVAGLWPMTNPGPNVAALLEEPQFASFHHDFGEMFRTACFAVLLGADRLNEVDS